MFNDIELINFILFVSDIAPGKSDLRLLGTYVKSPLCWAISTGKNSTFNSVEDLKGQVRIRRVRYHD